MEMINNKSSDSWYIEFFKTPEGIYHRVFKRVNGYLLFEFDALRNYEIDLINDTWVDF
jgi:hypothetical protein